MKRGNPRQDPACGAEPEVGAGQIQEAGLESDPARFTFARYEAEPFQLARRDGFQPGCGDGVAGEPGGRAQKPGSG